MPEIAEPPDSGTGTASAGRVILTKRRRLLAPILAVAFLFYYWTATTNANTYEGPGVRADHPLRFGTQHDYYNQLASALLRGHLSLLEHVPKALASLKDPYDPAQNAPFHLKYFDLVLYHDHFFLTWGPTPAVTLLMPWRLLHVGGMPLNLAILVYCCVGLLFAVALLCFLVDRYLPDTKPWQLGLASAALALSNIAPFMLRRPAVYELAVASGYCFAMIGAFLLATGGLGTRMRPWRLAGASLCVGLAVGGRPAYAFEGLLLLALLAVLDRRDRLRDWGQRLRLAAILLGPFGAILVLLLAYNYARFGSIFEYGIPYTLAAADFRKLPSPSLSYLAPGLYAYVIAPVRWTFAFPYFTLPPPPTYPGSVPSYYYNELTGGILSTTPILLALIPGGVLLWRRRMHDLGVIVLLPVFIGALMVLLLSVSFWFTTMRYEGDFAMFFLIPALLAWFALTRLKYRRLAAGIGALAILYGCTVGAAISIYGYYDLLRTTDPGTYWAIDRLTSPLPTLVTMIEGHPVVARVIDPSKVKLGNKGTYHAESTSFDLSSQLVEVDIVSPRSGRWTLAPTFRRTPSAGPRRVNVVVRYSNGTARRVSIGSRARGFNVLLHRGLNRITFGATADGVPQLYPIVSVSGVRLLKEVGGRKASR